MLSGLSTPLAAHHEAIFGPQSALVLSGDRYLTAQVFTRETGPRDQRTRETTTVLGAGFTPFRVPVSLSVVAPFSVIAPGGEGRTRVGPENAIVAARYRVDLPGLERAVAAADSYLLGVGGIELPTGTIDHSFGEGAPAAIGGALFSIERGPFSFIGYGIIHRYREHDGIRESGNTFVGGGAAWTPIDQPAEGRLFSVQLGISRESVTREEHHNVAQPDTGGHALVVHPTVMVGVAPNLMLFAVTSLPVAEAWNDPADEERFRVGVGAILTFGR